MNFNAIEFDSPDGEAPLSPKERLELKRELARKRAESAHTKAAHEINVNPELAAMLARLIEGTGELSEQAKAHLRKMIAISYHLYAYTTEAAASEREGRFYEMVVNTVRDELAELDVVLEEGGMPDLWSSAYEDFTGFEDNKF